jgi:hypothetical protein
MRTLAVLPQQNVIRSVHFEEAYVTEELASARLRDGVAKGANPILDVGDHAGMILEVLAEVVDRGYYVQMRLLRDGGVPRPDHASLRYFVPVGH